MKLDIPAIKQQMAKRGLSQTDLARALGTSRQVINQILKNESCTMKMLGRICEALGMSPNEALKRR